MPRAECPGWGGAVLLSTVECAPGDHVFPFVAGCLRGRRPRRGAFSSSVLGLRAGSRRLLWGVMRSGSRSGERPGVRHAARLRSTLLLPGGLLRLVRSSIRCLRLGGESGTGTSGSSLHGSPQAGGLLGSRRVVTRPRARGSDGTASFFAARPDVRGLAVLFKGVVCTCVLCGTVGPSLHVFALQVALWLCWFLCAFVLLVGELVVFVLRWELCRCLAGVPSY